MTKHTGDNKESLVDKLCARGYWPARAASALSEGTYSRAVEICKANLTAEQDMISGRLIYARALYHAGQVESAAEQFYHVLARDPDNLMALKCLGDIKFSEGDEIGAMANYQRILEIDPNCRGLKSDIDRPKKETTRTITLARGAEKMKTGYSRTSLRNIHFFTETIGDLYLAQGYPGLAAEVYRVLNERNGNPRLAEKLSNAEQTVEEKER